MTSAKSLNLFDLISLYSEDSISAHNTQPFVFKKITDFKVTVSADAERFLKIADPSEKDIEKSFGALFETLKIAGSNHQLKLKFETHEFLNWSIEAERSVEISIDKLYPFIKKRFSYRKNSFLKNAAEINQSDYLVTENLVFVSDQKAKTTVALLFDEANLYFLKSKGYSEELWTWLRLDTKHKNYLTDGLNDQALGFNMIEKIGASIIMKPSVFKFLDRFNLLPTLLSEKEKIISSPFVVFIVGQQNLNLVEQGQLFMRQWLVLTSQNIYGSPLSVLVDKEETLLKCESLIQLDSSKKIFSVLRAGHLDTSIAQPVRYRRGVQWL